MAFDILLIVGPFYGIKAEKYLKMTSFKYVIILLFSIIFLVACQNNEAGTPVSQAENKTQEITHLTSKTRIKDVLQTSRDSETIINPGSFDFNSTREFYIKNNYNPVWNDSILRGDLFKNIKDASDDGLFPEDYHVELLKKSLSSLQDLDQDERLELEIAFTAAFLKYTSHLAKGKLNPKEIYSIWGMENNRVDTGELLIKVVSGKNIDEVIDSVKPKHEVYLGLKKSLLEFKKLKDNEEKITKTEAGKSIKPGEEDSRLITITKRLQELDILEKSYSPPNDYNQELQEAIKVFQKINKLQVDGIIGQGTIKSLNKTSQDRYEQILVNLERWRWYPRNFGDHYIIVNVPNYELSVVKEQDTVSVHRTVVGTPSRKTPVFSAEIQEIVYNPTWTIPPTIKKYDVIPEASRDISYLSGKKINVYDHNGKILDPAEINWESTEVQNYTFRQGPGGSNPLGQVKINYPNEYLVFSHDTPSKFRFEENARAHSSGCVRVEDAISLSKHLLNDLDEYDQEKIAWIISKGSTKVVKMKQAVKIYHLYWTAWREDSTTYFADDIYKLDDTIFELLVAD